MKGYVKSISYLLVFLLPGMLFAVAPEKQKLDATMQEQIKTAKEGANSQKKIDKVADATRQLIDEYRRTLQKIDNTKIYNMQLREFIASQEKEMVSIREQIKSLKETNKEIIPLMVRMLGTLEKFVALDIPFLPEERANRLKKLNEMMKRADVSTSEKYRRIVEAYQVENDYGRTLEAYRGIQKHDGKELTVDFLRVGRVALIYQSLDGDVAGYWSKTDQKWLDLPGEYEKSVRKGLRIARKQLAPDLIKLPIPAPEVVK